MTIHPLAARTVATAVALFLAVLLPAGRAGAQDARSVGLGEALSPGMRLIYSSGGVETPWVVDSVAADTTLGGRSGCVRIVMRIGLSAPPTIRAFCADSVVLGAWDERTAQHRAARPIASGGSVQLRGARGSTSTIEAGNWTTDTVSGREFRVLETLVVTRDSGGRVVRRLRERFSLDLLTATSGTFEVPDAASVTGWRTERDFRLIRVTAR
jgi:hypothetical protein